MLTKVILITNKENLITGYRTSPIKESDKTYLVYLNKLHLNYSYIDENDCINYNEEKYNESLLEREKQLNEKRIRNKRKKLLEAFDKWEKAVLRLREAEDENIMQWYRDLLDLKESVFENIPDRIGYYL